MNLYPRLKHQPLEKLTTSYICPDYKLNFSLYQFPSYGQTRGLARAHFLHIILVLMVSFAVPMVHDMSIGSAFGKFMHDSSILLFFFYAGFDILDLGPAASMRMYF